MTKAAEQWLEVSALYSQTWTTTCYLKEWLQRLVCAAPASTTPSWHDLHGGDVEEPDDVKQEDGLARWWFGSKDHVFGIKDDNGKIHKVGDGYCINPDLPPTWPMATAALLLRAQCARGTSCWNYCGALIVLLAMARARLRS